MLRLPEPRAEVPRAKAPPFTRETVLLPELLRETAPPKLLALCVKLMTFAPALKLERPPTVIVPVCPMPAPTVVRSPLILEVLKDKVCVLMMLVLVPLVRATLPVKLLAVPLALKSMKVPALKVEVPGTVSVAL